MHVFISQNILSLKSSSEELSDSNQTPVNGEGICRTLMLISYEVFNHLFCVEKSRDLLLTIVGVTIGVLILVIVVICILIIATIIRFITKQDLIYKTCLINLIYSLCDSFYTGSIQESKKQRQLLVRQ